VIICETALSGRYMPIPRVSKDTVYKWIDKRGMPAHRMRRLWKFKKEQVDAWVEAGGAASHQPSAITEGKRNEA